MVVTNLANQIWESQILDRILFTTLLLHCLYCLYDISKNYVDMLYSSTSTATVFQCLLIELMYTA